MTTKVVSKNEEQFHRLANTALGLMGRVSASPKGSVRSYAKQLDKIATESADVVAALMLDEQVDVPKRYNNLRGKLLKVTESLGLLEHWFVMPSLGVGNDLWPQSGGGAMADTGVEPLPDMVPAGGVDSSSAVQGEARRALQASSVTQYVKSLLAEDGCRECGEELNEDGSCPKCK